ncbi:putative RNA methyltransferase [Mesobacillus maritimus]|uniref:putative RNA methyltransferase n=1 Tax=Mesobacillus maritimus TaxID=1643336 RepID=UPI00384FD087
MTQRKLSAMYVREFESIFKCPICHSSMQVMEFESLTCTNRHSYDFTKQGYLNLLTHPIKTKYGKELFEARRKLIADGGFFEPLCEAMADIIKEYQGTNQETLSVLDTGCGEGSHLAAICDIIRSQNKTAVTGVGVDLAKEGVLVAAKNYINNIWCVADLANTPFRNQQFDVILNILSPSNYSEFNRLLKDDGFVVKVVPQSGYLIELREAFFGDSDKQSYSNVDTVDHFNKHFTVVNQSRIQYTMNLQHPFIDALVQMTPLTWDIAEEKVKEFLEKDSVEITVDLDILIGRKPTI